MIAKPVRSTAWSLAALYRRTRLLLRSRCVEMAVRWSTLDLNNDNIHGGRLSDVTAGVNWYLNGYTKIQFNYIRAMQQKFASPNSSTDIFGVRAQVDW